MQKKLSLNSILLAVIAGLVLGIIFVSAVFLCTKNAVPGAGLRKIETKSLVKKSDASFDLIGLLRISTKIDSDQLRHVMIVSPWLEYDESDTQLYEELDRRLVSIKSLFNNYFSAKTKDELLSMNEDQIKAELLQQLNGILVLGKVSKIYVRDYMFLN